MEKKNITVKKLYSIPDTNGASNFGGIDTDGSTIFCIKSNQGETVATLHTIKADGSADRTKLSGLNHTNGLAYHDGYLYVPLWGSKNNKKGVCRISVKDHSKKNISADFSISNITHFKDNLFIVRTATSADKTKQTFHVIQITSTAIKKIKKFYVKNPVAGEGYKTNQDIYYKDGKIYIMETKANLLKSAVLVANIGTPTASTVYSCSEVWITGNTSKWEVESMCIDASGRVLFGMNTSADGVYMRTDVEVEKEGEKMSVINVVAGHSKTASGASKYLNEVTEDRKVKDELIKILKENGMEVYDCTSDAGTPSKVLSEQVQKCNTHKGVDVHIHFNAGTTDPNEKTTGTEVFVYSTSSKCKESAKKVCDNLASLGFTNRGLKYSTGLYVLKNSKNPAMLIEVCFVDDKDDYNLYKKVGVETIAKEIAKGLIGELNKERKDGPVNASYMVRITAQELNIRKGATISSDVVGTVLKGEVYSITEVIYNGSTAWGKLKSGVGYISLGYTEEV